MKNVTTGSGRRKGVEVAEVYDGQRKLQEEGESAQVLGGWDLKQSGRGCLK